jgi:ethanolamine utilization protein EutN
MRIGKVVGSVTLSRKDASLPEGHFVIVVPESAEALRAEVPPRGTPLVAFDPMHAGRGARVAFTEGREAAQPFVPQAVPVDAYCAAILDDVQL